MLKKLIKCLEDIDQNMLSPDGFAGLESNGPMVSDFLNNRAA